MQAFQYSILLLLLTSCAEEFGQEVGRSFEADEFKFTLYDYSAEPEEVVIELEIEDSTATLTKMTVTGNIAFRAAAPLQASNFTIVPGTYSGPYSPSFATIRSLGWEVEINPFPADLPAGLDETVDKLIMIIDELEDAPNEIVIITS